MNHYWQQSLLFLGDYASTVSNASKEQVIYPPVYAPPTYEIACGIPNEKTPFANMDAGNCNPPYPPSNVPYPMDDSLCKKDWYTACVK